MLKIIIGKLEKTKKQKQKQKQKKTLKLERLQRFCFLFFFFVFPSSSFKLKRLTQNPKTELKRLWVGVDSGTK